MAGVNVAPTAVLREELTGFVAGFNPVLSGFVAHRVLPPFRVGRKNGEWQRIPADAWLKQVDARRAPYAATSKSTYEMTQDTWRLEHFAHAEINDITDDTGYPDAQRRERVRTLRTAGVVLRSYERRVADLLFNTTNYPLSGNTGFTAGALWTNFATSTPVVNVQEAKRLIRNQTGMEANMVVIPRRNVEAASNSASVLDRVRGYDPTTRKGELDAALWAELFGVPADGIIVPNAFGNNAGQGLPVSSAPIWSDEFIGVGVVNYSEDIESPQLGRSFQLESEYTATGTDSTGTLNVDNAAIVVDEYSDPDTFTTMLRSSFHRQAKRLVNECWVLIKVR